MILHFDIIARYESLLSVQLGPVPVHVVFHVQDLEEGKKQLQQGQEDIQVGPYLEHRLSLKT